MISFAEKEDIPCLKKLWQEAFGEDESAGLFYDRVFEIGDSAADESIISDVKIIIYENTLKSDEPDLQNREVISMLHYIPCYYQKNGTEYNGAYLYALATDKRFRGQGIMGRLIQHAKELAKKQELDFLYLIPAEESLYEYYKRFDFHPVRHDDVPVRLSCDKEIRIQNITMERFRELALEVWEYTNISLTFEKRIAGYTILEFFSEKDFQGHEIMENNKIIGYYAVHKGKILYYGAMKDIFSHVEESADNTILKKSGSIFLLHGKQDISEITGYIPY